jgi:hypothetical protein
MLRGVFIAHKAHRPNFACYAFELVQLQDEINNLLHDLYLEGTN